MSALLCLVLPGFDLYQGTRPRLHWLADVGDALDPDRPIACLQGDGVIDVLVPHGIRGTLKSRLLEEGARVAPGNPLLTFLPQNKVGTLGDRAGAAKGVAELAEEASPYASSDPRSVVVAEVTDMKRLHPIAVVGLIFLVGMAVTVIATLVYLIIGGMAPLLVGALALSIVALALIYGEQHLENGNGFPG